MNSDGVDAALLTPLPKSEKVATETLVHFPSYLQRSHVDYRIYHDAKAQCLAPVSRAKAE